MITISNDTLLIATHNKAKYEQMREILSCLPYRLISLEECGITDDIQETGTTFQENALLKARHYAQLSGLPTLADDSGLVVHALGGEPGVYSSRYAGPHATDEQKVSYILKKMEHIPLGSGRDARFECAVALVLPDGTQKEYSAHVEGVMLEQPLGTLKKGFPYCVLFFLPEYGKTMAQLQDEKIVYDAHRLRVLKKVIADLHGIR
jgi:XTP/dITP diphosphohydrolase